MKIEDLLLTHQRYKDLEERLAKVGLEIEEFDYSGFIQACKAITDKEKNKPVYIAFGGYGLKEFMSKADVFLEGIEFNKKETRAKTHEEEIQELRKSVHKDLQRIRCRMSCLSLNKEDLAEVYQNIDNLEMHNNYDDGMWTT